MDREAIEQALNALYDTRLAGNVEGCVACFAPKGVFRMANLCDPDGRPMEACGHGQLNTTLRRLVDTWSWQHRDPQTLLLDGNGACVRYRLALIHTPSGEAIDTEIMDYVSFDTQYKATMFAQFVDTALVMRLSA